MAQPVTPQGPPPRRGTYAAHDARRKVGQLVQQRGKGAVTGPDKTQLSVEQLVREGRSGSVFNIYSFEETERLQKIAVEESRLGIPLLIGADDPRFPDDLPGQPCRRRFVGSVRCGASLARVAARDLGYGYSMDLFADVRRFARSRWGRVSEGGRGLQAHASPKRWCGAIRATFPILRRSLACVKHFAAYGAPQAGRNTTVDMSSGFPRQLSASVPCGARCRGCDSDDLVQRPGRRWLRRTGGCCATCCAMNSASAGSW